MPLYDWKCKECGHEFEQTARMSEVVIDCPECRWKYAYKQFSPNKNILIPGHFKMDRGWHLPPGGSTGSSPDVNNRIHAPKKETFKQAFEKNWRAAGGA